MNGSSDKVAAAVTAVDVATRKDDNGCAGNKYGQGIWQRKILVMTMTQLMRTINDEDDDDNNDNDNNDDDHGNNRWEWLP